jgi:hypothetical protein
MGLVGVYVRKENRSCGVSAYVGAMMRVVDPIGWNAG